MSKKNVLIIGAGAIGRGYLPWILPDDQYDLSFIDTNEKIIQAMQQRKTFCIYKAKDQQLHQKQVKVKNAWLPQDFQMTEQFSLIFINVGPRSCTQAASLIEGTETPVLVCENDPECVTRIKASAHLKNCYFAVPDVITSNSAPQNILEQDSLSVITEDGVLFYDEKIGKTSLIGQPCSSAELEKQWIAKLYLHNTPHCVAAYLGALAHFTYLHEAMQIPTLAQVVGGCMQEMLQALKLRWDIPHDFLDWYAEKELARFSNTLLCDPINRVAREPIRKLELDGRLVGAAQICLSYGFIPEHILIGIASALLFDSNQDADSHLQFMRKNLTQQNFLTHVLNLREGEPLALILKTRLNTILEQSLSLIRSIGGPHHAN